MNPAGAVDAIVVASFGGPEGPEDVMPFLENVTRGRNVPPERLLDVAEHYYALGGVSPINGQNRDLIAVGAYRRGSDPRVDLAVDQWPKMLDFLRQDMYEPVGIERSYADLKQLVTQFSAPGAATVR